MSAELATTAPSLPLPLAGVAELASSNAELASSNDVQAAARPTEAEPETPVPFASFLHQRDGKRSLVTRITVTVSLVAHVVVGAALTVRSLFHVDELRMPSVGVTMFHAPVPAPPAPVGPGHTAARPKPATRPTAVAAPRALTQPTQQQEPIEAQAAAAQGTDEDGADAQDVGGGTASDGVAGGVPGGVTGGTGSAAAPAPAPSPAAPTAERIKALRDEYLGALQARIFPVHRANYPATAQEQELEGRVPLLVTVDASGRLVNVQLAGACPHAVLCDAAKQSVRAAGPFPAPPPELHPLVSVDVPLNYALD